jgi:hypothetical protein
MLPPDSVNGYHYPPVPQNPSGAPNFAFAAPGRGLMGYGSPGMTTRVPATVPNDIYAAAVNDKGNPQDTLSNYIPDPMQSGQVPIHTMYPDADEPPQEFYLGVHGVGRDVIQRHSVESQQAVGWVNEAPTSVSNAQRFAPNPRNATYPEGGRVTSRMSQNTYAFTRPYDQRFARRFNGSHFSMADHRREYPVFGMAPSKTWRNTSRVDPPPWDANIVDSPGGPAPQLAPSIPVYEPPIGSQRFVFGG